MRNTFINTLTELARENEDIFLLCGDLGYSVLEPFADSFPDRFLNVGIAEQNMTQVAAGLAMEGYNVFTYSIGNFPTLRCMEQIRYDVCYHNANVKIVAVGAGYAYGPLGTSHHTTEDLSMLRSIPNMLVTAPSDAVEAAALANLFSRHKGPAYIRLNKAGEPKVHSASLNLTIGQFVPIRHGNDVLVITTGAILSSILNEVEANNLNWAVTSMPFVSHMDEFALADMAVRYKHIVTVEEHQLNGGFGSAILERLNSLRSAEKLVDVPIVHRIGIANEFVSCAGSQDFLRAHSGINLESVLHLGNSGDYKR
jgi:transketolase